MRRYNNPITREHLDRAYMGEPPAEVSAEEESIRPSIVKLRVSDGEFGRPFVLTASVVILSMRGSPLLATRPTFPPNDWQELTI